MAYQEDFQKRSRLNRPRNEKAHLKFFEVASKGGRHEDKDGKHAKRAIQRRLADEEVENSFDDLDDEY